MSNSSNTKMTIRNIELLNIIIANKIADMHICMPAKILEYDYDFIFISFGAPLAN